MILDVIIKKNLYNNDNKLFILIKFLFSLKPSSNSFYQDNIN